MESPLFCKLRNEAAIKVATYKAASVLSQTDPNFKKLTKELGPNWIEQIVGGEDEHTLRSGRTWVAKGGGFACETVVTSMFCLAFVTGFYIIDNKYTPEWCPAKTIWQRGLESQTSFYCWLVNEVVAGLQTFLYVLRQQFTQRKFGNALQTAFTASKKHLGNEEMWFVQWAQTSGFSLFRMFVKNIICPMLSITSAVSMFFARKMGDSVVAPILKKLKEKLPDLFSEVKRSLEGKLGSQIGTVAATTKRRASPTQSLTPNANTVREAKKATVRRSGRSKG
jgi:hypothetical protein